MNLPNHPIGELDKLFSCQLKLLQFKKYRNELKAIRFLYDTNHDLQEVLDAKWLKILKDGVLLSHQKEKLSKMSKDYRDEGNKVYRTHTGHMSDVLEACRLYTKAIMTAPAEGEELPLAYANRAIALYDFGYFKQAYDDCECALEHGYPDRLVHKLYARQALCAMRMKNIVKLKLHLDAMEEFELNAHFLEQKKRLKLGLEQLQRESPAPREPEDVINNNREGQLVVESTVYGRSMLAAVDYKENELIFSERASAFVPVSDILICQNCAATLMIPIPCSVCFGQVGYCSLKCRLEHAKIHRYECAAYQHKLFDHIGISHLALRVFLEGIPALLPVLSDKENATDLWAAVAFKKSSALEHKNIEYTESLRMMTHMDKMPTKEILKFAIVAKLLVHYLREQTDFFECVKKTKCPNREWEIFFGALLLRHIGQLICNATSCVSIVPIFKNADDSNYPLFSPKLWIQPFYVKMGMLHLFSDYEEVSAANFPYLSICNHACDHSFQPKFSGRYVQTFANRAIKAKEEIFNCYSLDYRKSKKSTRQSALERTYNFVCKCEKCTRGAPDQDYESFHRYRCENIDCKQIFVPHLPTISTLNWWNECDGLPRGEYIRCTHCKKEQRLIWYDDINELLRDAHSNLCRRALFKKFDELDNWLLDYHEIKLFFAFQIVRDCYIAHMAGNAMSNSEFLKIVEIMKFYLRGMEAQSRVNSVEYVVKMTYLWDFIAVGRYKCSHNEFKSMLHAISILSDEIKLIFMHYYESYIEDKLE